MIFWSKFVKKGYFWCKAKKLTLTIEVCIFKLIGIWNFSLKQQFSCLRPNFPKKQYFCFQTEKWAWLLNCVFSNWSKNGISVWNNNFSSFDQICPKMVFLLKSRKGHHHYWILHLQINLRTKFQIKIAILHWWTKFAQNRYFRSNIEKLATLLNSAYSNWSKYKTSAWNNHFDF